MCDSVEMGKRNKIHGTLGHFLLDIIENISVNATAVLILMTKSQSIQLYYLLRFVDNIKHYKNPPLIKFKCEVVGGGEEGGPPGKFCISFLFLNMLQEIFFGVVSMKYFYF